MTRQPITTLSQELEESKMCVIAIKNHGGRLGKKTIKKMFESNPDLCGVSYQDFENKRVITHRGLTLPEILKINAMIPDEVIAVYHFRIATSGSVSIFNAHPFPLWGAKDRKDVISDYSLSHNGIFGTGNTLKSDTHLIVNMIEETGLKKSLSWLDYICSLSKSKIAILSWDNLITFGKFETQASYPDIEFSNLYWRYDYIQTTQKWSRGKWDTNTKNWTYATTPKRLCLSCDIPLLSNEHDFCFQCDKKYPTICDYCDKPIFGWNRLAGLCDECQGDHNPYNKAIQKIESENDNE